MGSQYETQILGWPKQTCRRRFTMAPKKTCPAVNASGDVCGAYMIAELKSEYERLEGIESFQAEQERVQTKRKRMERFERQAAQSNPTGSGSSGASGKKRARGK